MKEGWTYKKLGEVCKISSGKSIKASCISNENQTNTIPCYGGNGLRGYVSEANSEGGKPIIGRVGAQCGNIHYCSTPFYATEHALVVSKITKKINPIWLCKELEYMNLKQYAEGAAQPVIAASRLMLLEIRVPPLSEQQRIVSRLDAAFAQIDALKANAEKQLSEARNLFQKALEEAMKPKEGWKEKKLGDLGNFKNGMNFAHNESGCNIRILGVGDFGDKFCINNPNELSTISLNLMPSNDYLLKDEDVVFVRSNGNKQLVGRSVVVKTNGIPVTFSGFCIRFRNNRNDFDVRYLLYYLKTKETREQLFGNGANISNLNQKILQGLKIVFPSFSEQQLIASRLDSLSENVKKLEELQRKTIAECDALKQAMLREIFE